ncbi:LacI family DNA-binding transcriptional regulator [Streptosporangium sp. NPDC006013]|uniref:LacI family DNA-binding transcriptional regulator n=1 Tax=Streptosporangium sp. NPDC006013 TaxID=3155596 RepID=UPI0033B8B215
MKPSLIDVAARAGVSKSTVSNVLQGRKSVAPEIRERVLRTIEELGYVRNESARLLRAGHSRTVGLVVHDTANPYFTDVARGIQEELSRHGLLVMLCNADNNPVQESAYLDVLEQMRFRGVILAPVLDPSHERIRALRDRGTSIVLIERDSALRDISTAACDDVAGGSIAMRHLLDLGHRDIGYVTGPLQLKPYRDRLVGAEAEIASRGVEARLRVFESERFEDDGRSAAMAMIAAEERPTAVFCGNDLIAVNVQRAATGAGLRLPDQLSIVGYDDITLADQVAASLTTVRQPRHALGVEAARLLLADAADPTSNRTVLLAPELVRRSSTSTAASHLGGEVVP